MKCICCKFQMRFLMCQYEMPCVNAYLKCKVDLPKWNANLTCKFEMPICTVPSKTNRKMNKEMEILDSVAEWWLYSKRDHHSHPWSLQSPQSPQSPSQSPSQSPPRPLPERPPAQIAIKNAVKGPRWSYKSNCTDLIGLKGPGFVFSGFTHGKVSATPRSAFSPNGTMRQQMLVWKDEN